MNTIVGLGKKGAMALLIGVVLGLAIIWVLDISPADERESYAVAAVFFVTNLIGVIAASAITKDNKSNE